MVQDPCYPRDIFLNFFCAMSLLAAFVSHVFGCSMAMSHAWLLKGKVAMNERKCCTILLVSSTDDDVLHGLCCKGNTEVECLPF